MRRIIELPHRAYDYNCMISGLESLIEKERSIRFPERLLLLASFIGFGYERTPRADLPRRVLPGSGIGAGQYGFLAPIFGYEWVRSEGGAFQAAWTALKSLIDRGAPAILGELDMFHMPYLRKFYHRIHVPIHYVTLVGYDDEQETAIVLDCGRTEAQEVPLRDLSWAMDVERFGDSRSNTFFRFDFGDAPKDAATLRSAIAAVLRKRSRAFLEPAHESEGLAALRRLIEEFPEWEKEMTASRRAGCLRHFATHTCSAAPMPPQKLAFFPIEEPFKSHQGLRDRFAAVLADVARVHGFDGCAEASAQFRESGPLFQDVTDRIADYLAAPFKTKAVRNRLAEIPAVLTSIVEIESKAFAALSRIA
jgi:hypothetical protein